VSAFCRSWRIRRWRQWRRDQRRIIKSRFLTSKTMKHLPSINAKFVIMSQTNNLGCTCTSQKNTFYVSFPSKHASPATWLRPNYLSVSYRKPKTWLTKLPTNEISTSKTSNPLPRKNTSILPGRTHKPLECLAKFRISKLWVAFAQCANAILQQLVLEGKYWQIEKFIEIARRKDASCTFSPYFKILSRRHS